MKAKAPRWVVDQETGCWIWTRCLDGEGYGRIFIEYESVRAHCYVYKQERGAIPPGMDLVRRRSCPRNCVNPDHMTLMTKAQNLRKTAELRRSYGRRNADEAKQRALASLS